MLDEVCRMKMAGNNLLDNVTLVLRCETGEDKHMI